MSTSTKTRPLINRKRAEALLREVVKGREDYVDPNAQKWACKYFTRSHSVTKPSCIVGNVLAASGVEVPFGPRSQYNKEGIYSLVDAFPNLFTPGAVKALAHAQQLQDSGLAWGEIVKDVLSHKKGRV